MLSCNSKGLSFFLKMWVGGYTLWFGFWLQVSKSPTSGKNIKWSLGFFFFILFGLKLWRKSLCLEHNLHNGINVGVWEKHMLSFVSMSTPDTTTLKKNTNVLRKCFWLRSSKTLYYVLTQGKRATCWKHLQAWKITGLIIQDAFKLPKKYIKTNIPLFPKVML